MTSPIDLNFIDSIKKYASEKWDKVVTTITDWKDAAVILGKVTKEKITSSFTLTESQTEMLEAL